MMPKARTGLLVLVAGATVAAVVALGLASVPTGGQSATDDITFVPVNGDVGFEYVSEDRAQMGNSRVGVYVADYNTDGYPDILAIGGDQPVLFENTGGEFRRSDDLPVVNETVKSALFFDFEGDGHDDLLLMSKYGPPMFFDNRGESYVRQDVGLSNVTLTVPVAATAGDYNGDGCLDVFVAQNGDWESTTPRKETYVSEAPRPGEVIVEEDNGQRNRLLAGNCENQTFQDATDRVGIEGERWSTATSFVDFTGDGRPDLHVSNDFNYDYLYVNTGDGFEQRWIPGTNRHGMASEVADFDGDGRMDVFVTNVGYDGGAQSWRQKLFPSMNNYGNTLLLNDGDGFEEAAEAYNVSTGGWGWAAVAVDFTNDGRRDLLHTTQYYRQIDDRSHLVRTRPRVWTGVEDGFRPVNASEAGFEPTNGRALVHLDFDRDGDQDLIVGNLAGEYVLYENRGATGNWLQLSVWRGDDRVLNAQVNISTEGGTRYLVTNAQAGLQSQSSRVAHVGLGAEDAVDVTVTFPDGTVREFDSIGVNRRVRFRYNGTTRTVPG